jgi:hypothetical protein
LSCNKRENGLLVCVSERAQHGQEVDGEPGLVEVQTEVHAGEEEGVLATEAALSCVRDFCRGELGAQGLLQTCVLLPSDFQADVFDEEGGESERGVVRVAEDLLEVPGARAGAAAGLARLGLDAEVVHDRVDAAVEDTEVVEDREHGEAVRGGVRVHAAAEGEAEGILFLAVLAEEREHGAGGRELLEDTAGCAAPGCDHGLEAVEAAQVRGGGATRLHAGEDVEQEVGGEALHGGGAVVCLVEHVLEVYILLLHRLIWCNSVLISVSCGEGEGIVGDSVRVFLDAGRKSWQ